MSKLAVTGEFVHFGAHRLGYLLNLPSRQPDRLCRHCVGFTILDEHLPVLQAEGKGEMPGYVTRSPSKVTGAQKRMFAIDGPRMPQTRMLW